LLSLVCSASSPAARMLVGARRNGFSPVAALSKEPWSLGQGSGLIGTWGRACGSLIEEGGSIGMNK
jgi:hypothetical protein